MKNIDLNAGAVIGALACGGIAAAVIFSNVDQAADTGRGPYKFIVLALIGGAYAGNFLWGLVFKKREPGPVTSDPEVHRPLPPQGSSAAERCIKQSSNSLWGVVIALFILIAAIAVEVFTVSIFIKAKEVENWPRTNGRILRSELTSKFHGSTTYEAQIEYEYWVGEKQYTSKQVRTRGTSTKHRSDVAALVEKFPVGRQVTVYYNPEDPSDAYLEVGVDFVNYIIIVSPLIFAFGAGAYLVKSFRRKRGRGANKQAEPGAAADSGRDSGSL